MRLGDLDVNETIADGASPIEVNIKEVIKHEKYTTRPVLNDITLLRLSQPVEYSSE